MTVNTSTDDSSNIINATRCWVEQVIIGQNFCPFAKREFISNRIHFQLSHAQDHEACLHDLINECLRLDQDADIETTLLTFACCMTDFDDFLDLIALANALLQDQGYEGTYQLAHFHPDYCFADSDNDDPANYTNRSPWPTLHLIREASLEKVLKNYPHPEQIPENNISRARETGLEKMRAMLSACSEIKPDK